MIIKNIKINGFAGIADKEINFQKGINIVYGENEKGKSTILKFILGMFYGLSKNKNGKEIPDIEKYKPWKTEEFSGKLKYALDNKEEFEVFRKFTQKNPKIFNKELEDISKEFSIDKTKGNNFFEEQTGVSEEIFLNTNMIQQEETKLNINKQNNLIQKITNMVSSGNDNVSYKNAIDRINKKQLEEIGTERSTGRPINIIEDKISKINKEKTNLEQLKEKKEFIENKVKEEKIKNIKIENKINLLKKIKIEKERENLEEKLNINNKLKNELNEKIENLETMKEKIFEEKINNKYNFILLILFIIIFFIVAMFFKNNIILFSGIIIEIVLFLFYLKNKIKINKIKKENNIKNDEKQKIKKEIEILEENKKETQDKIKITKDNNLLEKEKTKKIIKTEFNQKIEDDYFEDIFSKNLNQINILLSELENENTKQKISLHTTEIEKEMLEKNIENYIEKEEELENLKEQKKELEFLNSSIQIAKDELENAYNSMKENVTPKFSEKLSEIIERISNGKYKKVVFNDEDGIKVELENGDYIPLYYLSVGTIDQMYLSLRMSAIDEISKESIPIILDETFAYFDDERLKNILNYLAKEFENKQAILLTCTRREKEILDKLKINYNLIEL